MVSTRDGPEILGYEEEFRGLTGVLYIMVIIAVLWAVTGIVLTAFLASHWVIAFCLFWWLILTLWGVIRFFDTYGWLRRNLFHWKMMWFGHKDLEAHGQARIPCKRCGHMFISYQHYAGDGGFCYDAYCDDCEKDIVRD